MQKTKRINLSLKADEDAKLVDLIRQQPDWQTRQEAIRQILRREFSRNGAATSQELR
jgi:hypothetical protein